MINRKTPPQVSRLTALRAATLVGAAILAPALLGHVSQVSSAVTGPGDTTLLNGQRIETGTVVEVLPAQIGVMTDHPRPRYLGIKESLSFTIGDKVEMVINAQNAVIDYYAATARRPTYQIVEGRIAASLEVGHEHAVVATKEGDTRAFRIKPVVRSKVASIPVGVKAVFLVRDGTILDGSFASEKAVERAEARPHEKSPIKGAHRQVAGTLVGPAAKGHVKILTQRGNDERSYAVRSYVMKKLTPLKTGQNVILLVDRENKVIDVAIPPDVRG